MTGPGLKFYEHALAEQFGLRGSLTSLPGEYDLNFLLTENNKPTTVFKVMRPDCNTVLVDLQCAAIDHLNQKTPSLPLPRVLKNRARQGFGVIQDEQGESRLAWCISYLQGEVFAESKPRTPALRQQLGGLVAQISEGLEDFDHEGLRRDFKWDLLKGLWIQEHLGLIEDETRQGWLTAICHEFKACLPTLKSLPQQALHNDLNDQNLLVQFDNEWRPFISGVLDFGDLCLGPRVCELAIAAAYGLLGEAKPIRVLTDLVSGYHGVRPLGANELPLVLPLVRMRLAVSVVNAALMKQKKPDDPYVVISERPAWALLKKLALFSEQEILARLRVVCGYGVSDDSVLSEVHNMGPFEPVLGIDLNHVKKVDLSLTGDPTPKNPLDMDGSDALNLGRVCGHTETISYYGEPRLIYTEPAFRESKAANTNRRTIHTGVDIFAAPGTPVCAPLSGEVVELQNRGARLDYGGLVVLAHKTPTGQSFWTLYGHLDPRVVDDLCKGDCVRAGEAFGCLGDADVNGGWAPHLHFQMALATDGIRTDWLAVADPDEADFWMQVYPNPAVLLNMAPDALAYESLNPKALEEQRQNHFSKNLKLSYEEPCLLLRGWQHYLFDHEGRQYLDAYNNVPHVGHGHPRVQAAVAKQWSRLNTNTRYLHPAQGALSEHLLSKLPESLSVCFFVNSASEANEVALRLAKTHTGGRHMIVPDHGYHGITSGAIDLSAYKFNGPGGSGPKDWVHVVSVPDTFRGPYKAHDPEAGTQYGAEVSDVIRQLQVNDEKLAGFIAETFPSVGGQLVPPPGYLQCVYEAVRSAGGVCIADEVQTGLGRLGQYYWGFEQQGVVPDMVVLGKPLGNGQPVAAVITTRAIAESFVSGMEFFSTFGGSTVSCVAAHEVLKIVDDEKLDQNAQEVGSYLLEKLTHLQRQHPVIGDVRGMGFFIGVEMIKDPASLAPATQLANYVKNRLRQHRILIGTDGPHDNVLKIRPPLTFGRPDADLLVATLAEVLSETPVALHY